MTPSGPPPLTPEERRQLANRLYHQAIQRSTGEPHDAAVKAWLRVVDDPELQTAEDVERLFWKTFGYRRRDPDSLGSRIGANSEVVEQFPGDDPAMLHEYREELTHASEQLRACLERFPPRLREVIAALYLAEGEPESQTELAERINSTSPTITKRKQKGLHTLRVCLEDHGVSPEHWL